MTVRFFTLGCKVNQYESEAMLELLLQEGFTEAADHAPADVVVVNSCTVTATSDQKARQTLRRVKRQNPGAVTVLTGCWPQAFPEQAAGFPEADIVLGTANRTALAGHLRRFLETGERIVDIAPHEKGEAFEKLAIARFHGRTRAIVKIEDGCDRFCSYCIIPYARGRVRSKPLEDLRAEVRQLAAHGFREVVLTGINLPCYGQDLGLTLCDAIEAACAEPAIRRVRLGSLEPEQLTPDVIARLAKQDKLCPQFHLSLQSGCDATLKRMNRHYTTAQYRQIVADLRGAFPNCAVTTDIMVGFAGETEEEFAASLAFAREMAFARVHVFAYSRRPGTRAYDAPGQVSNAVKEARSRTMIAATEATRLAFCQAQAGRVEEVLFEEPAGEGWYRGYTPNYTPVRVRAPKDLQGLILPVRLLEADVQGLLGEIDKN